MKASNFVKIAVLVMPMLLTACGSKKKVAEQQAPVVEQQSPTEKKLLNKVQDNSQETKFITSKIKFSVEFGQQDITLTGNLRMKRDDVIRIQLMAFGFVEAARLEFTKEYVLIMDRINKQYLMAPYVQIDFLRNSGLNFASIQALFWNELFQPNKTVLTDEDVAKFKSEPDGTDAIVSFEAGKMLYSWLVNQLDGTIRMANIMYKSPFDGNSQLNWDYQAFERVDNRQFPTQMNVTLTTPKRTSFDVSGKGSKAEAENADAPREMMEVKLGMQLSYISNESEWETRTQVSSKYREVTVTEILRRFMAL